MKKEVSHWITELINKGMVHIVVNTTRAKKGQMCFSGGRDRSLAQWTIKDLTQQNDFKPSRIRLDAHSGWVWDLAANSVDNASVVYSASWDNTVKAWDITSGLECIQSFSCGMAALSLVASDNLLMAGLYNNKVLAFDVRAGPNHIQSYRPNKGAILAMSMYKNMVASVSNSKNLTIWDQTAGKFLHRCLKIPIATQEYYASCISWNSSALYVGDSMGSLHLFNPEDFTYIRTHSLWVPSKLLNESHKMVGCHQTKGNMVVGSNRGEIKFFYNCNPPREYCTITTDTIDVTKLQYQNGVLAVGSCDTALEFWIPKEKNDAV
ncbi:unnamed protein product [Leptidea sinapis]|uniref:Uncharacterized protein n=1 Tax=Leptidea sinapis TaxID=189913 RepID=A0A5E4QDU7_9NEOP|nr:unnamed protein product [Leptidea sinapis]